MEQCTVIDEVTEMTCGFSLGVFVIKVGSNTKCKYFPPYIIEMAAIRSDFSFVIKSAI